MPAAGGPAPQRRVADLTEPTWRLLLGRGLPQFALEAVVPVLAFYAGLQAAGLAAGILATSVVSIAIAVGLVRRGRDVSLVALGVVFVAIQAAVGLVSGSTTVYLAQPVVFSALAGPPRRQAAPSALPEPRRWQHARWRATGPTGAVPPLAAIRCTERRAARAGSGCSGGPGHDSRPGSI